MARQERQPHEFVPGIIKEPEIFSHLVTSHPLYISGKYKTLTGQLEIELELIRARSSHEISCSVSSIGSNPLRELEDQVAIAVLEDLRFRG